MKYCPFCNTPLHDDAKFCNVCGAAQNVTAPVDDEQTVFIYDQPVPVYEQPVVVYEQPVMEKKKEDKSNLIILLMIILIIICGTVICLGLFVFPEFFGEKKSAVSETSVEETESDAETAKDAVIAYIEAFCTSEFETQLTYALPDSLNDDVWEELGLDRDEWMDTKNDYYENNGKKYGKGWKLSYKIVSAEDMEKNAYKKLSDALDDIDVDVRAAQKLKCNLTYIVGGKETTVEKDYVCYQYDGNWYVADEDIFKY